MVVSSAVKSYVDQGNMCTAMITILHACPDLREAAYCTIGICCAAGFNDHWNCMVQATCIPLDDVHAQYRRHSLQCRAASKPAELREVTTR